MSNKKGPDIFSYGPDPKKEIEFYKKELDYYQKQLVECREIIEQLFTHKVKDYIFIHPFDLFELIDNEISLLDLTKGGDFKDQILTIKGKKYKETINIPARNITLK